MNVRTDRTALCHIQEGMYLPPPLHPTERKERKKGRKEGSNGGREGEIKKESSSEGRKVIRSPIYHITDDSGYSS